ERIDGCPRAIPPFCKRSGICGDFQSCCFGQWVLVSLEAFGNTGRSKRQTPIGTVGRKSASTVWSSSESASDRSIVDRLFDGRDKHADHPDAILRTYPAPLRARCIRTCRASAAFTSVMPPPDMLYR